MSKRPSVLADLDIASEALAQQDGLAERLARQRERRASTGTPFTGPSAEADRGGQPLSSPVRDANSWRRGKSLLQVAIAEDAHIELSVIAKRRRMTLSQVVKAALNHWLASHGHNLELH